MASQSPQLAEAAFRIVAPSFSRHFSGVTASMIAVVPEQARRVPIVATGTHLPEKVPQLPAGRILQAIRKGPWRIWHARRNIEMLAGLILRHLFRCPLILLWTSAALRRHSWITRWYYGHMDAIIATTAKAAAYLDRPSRVVRHGVDTDVFFPPASDAERDANWAAKGLGGRHAVGAFGRIRPSKGTDLFVDALCRVLPERPDWHGVIIGQTLPQHRTFEQGLRDRVGAAGLTDRIHFIGRVDDFADIPRWYRSLSLVACPSRSEGFGLTCLEAMASGCPVVASEAGAYPEIVGPGDDGWLVPCGEVEPLARALAEAMAEPGRLRRRGEAACNKVSTGFRIRDEALGIEAAYRELFARYGQPDL